MPTGRASVRWSGSVNRLRGYGDFLHYHLLARGALDAVLESDVNILDIAALTVIVREAGGTVTDLAGGEIGLASTTILATNGALHAPVPGRYAAMKARRGGAPMAQIGVRYSAESSSAVSTSATGPRR